MKKITLEQFNVVIKFLRDEINKNVEIDSPTEIIKQWHIDMTTPLNKDVIKYAKAVERITQHIPVFYTACQYKDKNVIKTNSLLQQMNAYDILREKEDITEIWGMIEEANKLCSSYHDYVIVTAPTREQLQENIARHKNKKVDSNSSICDSFYASLVDLYSKIDKNIAIPETSQHKNEAFNSWKSHMQKIIHHNGTTFEYACNNKLRHLLSIPDSWGNHPELCNLMNNVDANIWSDLVALNSLCSVTAAIPVDMMSHIESCADKLATDIRNGKMSMENISFADISDMGQRVLSQCSPEDMSKLSENMAAILPALTNLQQGMQGMQSVTPNINLEMLKK